MCVFNLKLMSAEMIKMKHKSQLFKVQIVLQNKKGK